MKTYTDLRLIDIKGLIKLIKEENRRQVEKWGIQERTAFEWMAYITEEVGSLSKAISECEYRGDPRTKVISEAIQVATLCLKVAEMYRWAWWEESQGLTRGKEGRG